METAGTKEKMLDGIVVSGYGGFYQVRVDDTVLNCKPRGRLKKMFKAIMIGDHVQVSQLHDDTAVDGVIVDGMIEQIAPRRNSLLRPHIANVDQVIITLAWHLPDFDLLLLDRMLLMCRMTEARAVICFNKIDLMTQEEQPLLAGLQRAYAQSGCMVLTVSAHSGEGLDKLRSTLSGRVSVLAGPSGVGKSSLLNYLLPEENAEIGAVSERLLRGKHTTRYVRLLPVEGDNTGGMIADSPGFFVLDTPDEVDANVLPTLYPEYVRLYEGEDGCRFDGCRHDREPDCAVRRSVEQRELDEQRYQRYLRILHEIKTREVKY